MPIKIFKFKMSRTKHLIFSPKPVLPSVIIISFNGYSLPLTLQLLNPIFLSYPTYICQEILLSSPLEYIQNPTTTLFEVDNITSCLYYFDDLPRVYSLLYVFYTALRVIRLCHNTKNYMTHTKR